MKTRICAVFDIDDTLYLERDYVRSGFEAVGNWSARWLHIDDFAARSWSKFVAGDRGFIFDGVLRESGLDPNPELVSALVDVYRTHTPAISFVEDAYLALHEISDSASIAVVTDGAPSSQSRKAEALGLPSFAAPIVLTGVWGNAFRKPHPRAFEQVAKCCPASAYVYIADNPAKDFAGPKQLGWFTIRVRRPAGLHYSLEMTGCCADHEIPDCGALPELLAQL